jgi:two-component system, cell cycle sensor histidine kinase and response regulator CckA
VTRDGCAGRGNAPAHLAIAARCEQISAAPDTFGKRFAVTAPRTGSWRILVVDDESVVRRFAVRVLEAEGFLVSEAADGAEALRLLQEEVPDVDAVVSDIVMPRLNGVELLQVLSSTHPQVPVLLMSGYASGELQSMGIAAPCAILVKPFTPERLVEELRRCLRGAGV